MIIDIDVLLFFLFFANSSKNFAHTCAHTLTHLRIHSFTHSRTHTHVHTHVNTRSLALTLEHLLAHIHIHTTHTHTTHTHTHTHTHLHSESHRGSTIDDMIASGAPSAVDLGDDEDDIDIKATITSAVNRPIFLCLMPYYLATVNRPFVLVQTCY